jgi:putative pyoverdin transport system ATP-binding/permease protein
MNLFQQFSARAPNRVFLAIVLGGLAGMSYSLLIPVVLDSLGQEDGALAPSARHLMRFLSFDVSHHRLAAVFFALCVLILAARTVSQLILVAVSIEFTKSLRLEIYERILRAPVVAIDSLGASRLNAVLTDDVRRVVFSARMLPDLLVNLVTVIGMLGFLYYLSVPTFWFVIKALVFGAVTFQLPVLLAQRGFKRSRVITDALYEGIRGLVHGIKELKLDARKRRTYLAEVLVAQETELARADKRAMSTMALATNYGDLISFFVIGSVAFVFVNYHSLGTAELTGVVMALLYLTGPVAIVLNAAPQIAMGKVSLQRIEQTLATLEEETAERMIVPVAPWEVMRLAAVRYRHRAASGEGFEIGPIDIAIRRGQITFIVGGNGSGKSTLSKLITLHYRPSQGAITFDGQPVTDTSLESFRQEIAAIYSDYYLFDRLLGETTPEMLAQAEAYLAELGLRGKVGIHDGRFSTLALSDGQKRRVALLVAFLENKNLYLFDEWAADQDPAFKRFFYTRVLPDLKARGKSVVVISHDDRYFGVADQLVVMESGQLMEVHAPHADAHPLPATDGRAPAVAAGIADPSLQP